MPWTCSVCCYKGHASLMDATALRRGEVTFAATKSLILSGDATALRRGEVTFAATKSLSLSGDATALRRGDSRLSIW